jgi:ParB-like chromosome segregation protein Spo0J
MNSYPVGQVCPVALDQLGDRFRRYRLRVPQAVTAMAQSLRRWGQCAPIVATVRQERPQVLDGFTRWEAALQVRGMTTLLARLIDVDDRGAKAVIHGLNQTGRRPHELEEAWIVQALVREDGLSQLEVAELLGRHKSWVCRRLALIEKLYDDVRQDLEVGLLTPTAAREIARLPAGNQSEVLDLSRRETFNSDELSGVVRLLLGSVTAEQKMFVLTKPREADWRQLEFPPCCLSQECYQRKDGKARHCVAVLAFTDCTLSVAPNPSWVPTFSARGSTHDQDSSNRLIHDPRHLSTWRGCSLAAETEQNIK